MRGFYSPLRYPGGKTKIYSFVSKLLFENDLTGINYAEPYAGGSGLALKLLFNEDVNDIYINDLDRSIYCFWKTILDCPTRFCTWIDNVELDMKTWKNAKCIQEDKENVSEFELAKSTFFLNRTNVSGIIKGGPIGGYEQDSKYDIGVRFNRKTLKKRIQKIAEFKDRIHVSSEYGIKFVKWINNLERPTFLYLDPPYYEKAPNLYMNYYDDSDHSALSNYMYDVNKPWLISYDLNDAITELYRNYRKISYKISQSTSNRRGDEILIFSDSLSFDESINELNYPSCIRRLDDKHIVAT